MFTAMQILLTTLFAKKTILSYTGTTKMLENLACVPSRGAKPIG